MNDAGAPHVVQAEIVLDDGCLIATVGARTADTRVAGRGCCCAVVKAAGP